MRLITGASAAAGTSGRMIPPAVVAMPLTSTRSLTATSVPWPDSSEIDMKAFRSERSLIRFRASSMSITPILGSGPGPPRYPCPPMSGPSGGFAAANLSWSKVDVLTSYERLTAEIQVRGGRLRETINDPEPLFHLRNVSAEPLLTGAVPLSGVPEGLFNKNFIGGIRTIEPEPPPPDMVADMIRRYVMFRVT